MTVTSRPEIVGTFGVVATTHWLASAAGMAMLERGGNAFDAAVAAGTVLNVVEPDQNGPGGDVPVVLWSAAKAKVEVICGQGTAPAGATSVWFRDQGFDRMPGSGHLPAVVPGSFGAWMLLAAEYGTLPLRDLLAPVIAIATEGFLVKHEVADLLVALVGMFTTHWPSSAEVFLPGGQAPEAGSLLAVPAQAATYRRLVAESEAAGRSREHQIEAARRAWYEGFVAEAIDRFFRQPVMDTSGVANKGLLSGADLAGWRAAVEEPITYDYGEYTVCKAGPWAQSPVMLQQLALLKGFDIAGMAPTGPDFVHTVQECAKLALADREAFYGDPRFVDVPLARLLSDDYNAARRALVDEYASLSMRPGTVPGYGGAIALRDEGSCNFAHAETADVAAPGSVTRTDYAQWRARHPGDTCHFDIIDRWGNMISGTPSGGWCSGSPVVPGLGFCVSTRGQMFSLDADHPNAIQPGKRPRTTLTPSLALRRGEPYLVFGTPGGDQQDQWALHAFLRHVHHGMNLQQAVDAPSFHTNHVPSSFFPREWVPGHLAIEGTFPSKTLAALDRRGHRLDVAPRWGHYNSVTMASRVGRVLRAGASPRRMQCYAVGR
jgi:gamma-glutamyltranspeptidase/glutathione hydrolase